MTDYQFDIAEVWQSYEQLAGNRLSPAVLWARHEVVQLFGPVTLLLGTDLAGSLHNVGDDYPWKPALQELIDQTYLNGGTLESKTEHLRIRSKLIQFRQPGPAPAMVLTLLDALDDRAWTEFCKPPVAKQASRQSTTEPSGVIPVATSALSHGRNPRILRPDALRYREAMQGSSLGVIEFDLDESDWVYADDVERLLGFKLGELRNSRKLIRQRIHPDDLAVNDHAKQLESEGRATSIEIRIKDRSGQYRWFAIHSRVSCDDQNQPQRVIGTIADIDELKKAQLKSSEQVRRRDELITILSHELRNPMAAITFSLDCLDTLDELPGESRQLLDIIARQTAHMSQLLQDLLDVSRLTRKRINFEMVHHDLNESIADVVDSVLPSMTAKRQKFDQRLSEKPLLVQGDAARLKQVMINLLDNASKYTPDEGQISLETREMDGQVFFSISDSGYGLDESKQESLFELFYQAEVPSQSRAGIGVGLFLVDQIMRVHDGSVFAESEGPGKGSTFTISLPCAPGEANAGGASELPAHAGNGILLVDDNEDSLNSLSRLLKQHGCRVIEFVDGESAAKCLNSIEFSVAIIDVDLPGISGLQLAREIRSIAALESAVLVAMTGYSQLADRTEIMAAGFDIHIVKPTNYKHLSKRIAEVLVKKTKTAHPEVSPAASHSENPTNEDERLFGNHA